MKREKMSETKMTDALRNFELQPSPDVWERIAATDTAPVTRPRTLRYVWIGAATVVVLTGLLMLWYVNRHEPSDVTVDLREVATVTPDLKESVGQLPDDHNASDIAPLAGKKIETSTSNTGIEPDSKQELSPVQNPANSTSTRQQTVVTKPEKHSGTPVAAKQPQNPSGETGKVAPQEGQALVTTADQKENTTNDTPADNKTSTLEVFIPSAFTPDNDGVNDIFLPVIQNNTEVKEYRMQIFSRNGTLLFESVSQDIGWDGRFQGLPVEDAVGVYVISFRDAEGNPYLRRGTITIIR